MKKFARLGSNILNALAFANADNMSEFLELLNKRDIRDKGAIRHPGVPHTKTTTARPAADLPNSAATITKIF